MLGGGSWGFVPPQVIKLHSFLLFLCRHWRRSKLSPSLVGQSWAANSKLGGALLVKFSLCLFPDSFRGSCRCFWRSSKAWKCKDWHAGRPWRELQAALPLDRGAAYCFKQATLVWDLCCQNSNVMEGEKQNKNGKVGWYVPFFAYWIKRFSYFCLKIVTHFVLTKMSPSCCSGTLVLQCLPSFSTRGQSPCFLPPCSCPGHRKCRVLLQRARSSCSGECSRFVAPAAPVSTELGLQSSKPRPPSLPLQSCCLLPSLYFCLPRGNEQSIKVWYY